MTREQALGCAFVNLANIAGVGFLLRSQIQRSCYYNSDVEQWAYRRLVAQREGHHDA